MPDTANASAAAYADGGTAVGVQREAQLEAHVCGQGLHSQPFGRPFDDPTQLGFARGEGDVLLGRCPMLEHV